MCEQMTFDDLIEAPGQFLQEDKAGDVINFDDVWRYISQKVVLHLARTTNPFVLVEIKNAGTEGAVINHGGKVGGLDEDNRITYADMKRDGDVFRIYKRG